MTALKPARIFISYSTMDGATFAAKLRQGLEAIGFSIWQDIVALQGNADWWSQIENALRSKELQHFILVVTPGALASPVVRREIRLARQEGKTVSPVRGPGIGDMSKMPRWLGNLYDLDISERRTNLLRVLELPSSPRRVPMMAPEPPSDFVPRPTEFDALKEQLLDGKGDAIAITAALRGAGGYGKTTLARALAHDPDIQDAYFDGVLWVELGEQGGGRVLALICDLVALITGETRTMTTLEAARTAMAEALGDRRILLVIDDIWQRHHLESFLHGGRRTTRLVTTRFSSVLPDSAIRQKLDAMGLDEAQKLIASGLPADQVAKNSKALSDLAKRLGEWPLLLKLVNSFLRDNVAASQSAGAAIAEANQYLDEEGLTAFDADDANDRTRAVASTINVSLRKLQEVERLRFSELGIFPEDAEIPIGIVERLWLQTGKLTRLQTAKIIRKLYDLSLLLNLDLERRTIRLHDTMRHFLQYQAGETGLVAQHKMLIQALEGIGGGMDTHTADIDYFYHHLPLHLADAGERNDLEALLVDPAWLKCKLEATKNPLALLSDYERYGCRPLHSAIGQVLRLTIGICSRDPSQLLPQLHGRLISSSIFGASTFCEMCRDQAEKPALLTTTPSLTTPGAESGRLEGHKEAIWALTVLPDGRLASGSYDGTVRLWNPLISAETACLIGHTGPVTALAVLQDGRIASCSDDGTVRIWDPVSGVELISLKAQAAVTALAVLQDGRLASGSHDGTVRIWDPVSGTELISLKAHTDDVTALALLQDGRLASGSHDGTVRIWDPVSGVEAGCCKGHTARVSALAVLNDGRLASASFDGTIGIRDPISSADIYHIPNEHCRIFSLVALPDNGFAYGDEHGVVRLWNATTFAEVSRSKVHAGRVTAIAGLPDGRLASGEDVGDLSALGTGGIIRLWEPKNCVVDPLLSDLDAEITAVAVLPDGLTVSGSLDSTLRLWDPSTRKEVVCIEGHEARIWALAVLPDGQFVSGSLDDTLRIWDPLTGREITCLEGDPEDDISGYRAIAILSDAKLASTDAEGLIDIWDWKAATVIDRIESHYGSGEALVALPDGRIASAGADQIIRLSFPFAEAEVTHLEGHTGIITALTILPDGRLASGSGDCSIRLWDSATGEELKCLEGSFGPVNTVIALPSGLLAVGSSDNSVQLWDPDRGVEVTRLDTDAAIVCLAVEANGTLVAGDQLGRIHWLEIVE